MDTKQKKILFFGTPEIAVPSLEALSKHFEVIGVGVFPDKPVGRKKILQTCPVKSSAQKLNLPIFEITSKKDLLSLTNRLEFDVAVVIAFGMIFPKEVLAIAPFINVHFSLLPKLRGASPVQSALLSGEKNMGITWQKMVFELDAGDILHQQNYLIEGKNCAEVWEDFSIKTAEIFPSFLNNFFEQKIKAIPQDPKNATFCSKFQKKDGAVFPTKETAEQIYNKFLAFTPWPGVFLENTNGIIKLVSISLKQKTEFDVEIECRCLNKIFIQKLQFSGKSAITAQDFRNAGNLNLEYGSI